VDHVVSIASRYVPATVGRWIRRLVLITLAALTVFLAAPLLPTPLTAPTLAHADTCDVVGGAVSAIIPGADTLCDVGGDVAGAVIPSPIEAAGNEIKEAANDGFTSMTESLLNGFSKMIQQSLTWFIELPTPQAQQWDPVHKIQQWTVQIQLIGLVASIIAGAIRLQMAKRQAVYSEGEELFHSLQRAVFGAWMFGGVMIGLTAGVDRISTKILDLAATDGTPAEMAKNMFNTSAMLGSLGVGLMFMIAVIGILGAILQAILLIARQSMLIVVVSIIPIIGAASGTKLGKNAFSKTISWTISLLLWKPVAALTYAVAFMLAGTTSEDGAQILYGVLLLSLAAAVLPMLTKLVSGGMAMSGGSGLQAAAMTMGVVAAGGTMAATGGASAAAGGVAGAAAGGGATAAQAGGSRAGGDGGVTRGGGDTAGSGSGSGSDQPPRSGSGSGATPNGSDTAAAASSPSGGSTGDGGGGGSTMSEAMSNASGAMQMSSAAEDFFDDNSPATAGDAR
jgi:type IV secretion system protein TrbL